MRSSSSPCPVHRRPVTAVPPPSSHGDVQRRRPSSSEVRLDTHQGPRYPPWRHHRRTRSIASQPAEGQDSPLSPVFRRHRSRPCQATGATVNNRCLKQGLSWLEPPDRDHAGGLPPVPVTGASTEGLGERETRCIHFRVAIPRHSVSSSGEAKGLEQLFSKHTYATALPPSPVG